MLQDEQNVLVYEAIRVDLSTHRVLVQGRPVHLTDLQFRLLCYLILHAGQALSRQEILSNVWGLPPNAKTRTLDMHICTLRKELGLTDSLETVFRIGYRLRLPCQKEESQQRQQTKEKSIKKKI